VSHLTLARDLAAAPGDRERPAPAGRTAPLFGGDRGLIAATALIWLVMTAWKVAASRPPDAAPGVGEGAVARPAAFFFERC